MIEAQALRRELVSIASPTQRVGMLLVASAGAILAAALLAQYGLGMRPCDLCQLQRIPWALALLAGVGTLILPAGARPLVAPLGFVFVLLAGTLGLYHVGVEQGAWPSFLTSCSGGGGPLPLTVADVLKGFDAPPPPRCDVAASWWFGWSMALWNALASGGVLALGGLIWLRPSLGAARFPPKSDG